jgi:hypothetical protein
MNTLEDLRKLAKLHLCEDCFQKYVSLIEPTVSYWYYMPLGDWKQVESQITAIVMKVKGVFKDNMFTISYDSNDGEVSDCVANVEMFKKIGKWRFIDKINYLRKERILQDSSYRLLDKARELRNKIHPLSGFSEQDYALFRMAKAIADKLWSATMIDQKEETATQLKFNAERLAKQYLKLLFKEGE